MDVGKRSYKSHVAGRLCVELRTDVAVDESLMSVFAGLRALPSLLVPVAPSLTLPPDAVEEIVDCAPVNMYPYPPVAAPTYLEKCVPGLLILTNFRLVFVVKDHLQSIDAEADVEASAESTEVTGVSSSVASEHEEGASEARPSVDSSFVDVGAPSSGSENEEEVDDDPAPSDDDEDESGLYGEDASRTIPAEIPASVRDGPPAFPGEVCTKFIDNGRPSVVDPQYYFQV
jgi:hypothetical protein